MIHVETPGLFTTVQDLGRQGFGPLGVSASGACDPVALRIANKLVGNPESAAGLEMTLQGGRFLFAQDAIIALGGSDFDAGVPLWTTHRMEAGRRLKIGRSRSGARCYLAVRGGIAVPLVLGSASTHVLSGLGGLEGRVLRKGDTLRVGPAPSHPPRHSLSGPAAMSYVFRVTEGPQAHWFDETFYAPEYTVTPDANRMGLRLEGPALSSAHSGSMVTEGVSLGCIQVPASGKPVILFVEQQTTGGYPKIANVISADLSNLGQLKPGDRIRFRRVDLREAREALYIQERWIAAL